MLISIERKCLTRLHTIKSNMKQTFYNIKNSISSIISWWNVIRKDRDWDWRYILLLERHKLTKVLKRLESNMFYIGQETDMRKIKICISLIDVAMSDDEPDVYVNIKNTSTYVKLKDSGIDDKIIESIKYDIRMDKAIKLYYKIKADNLLNWWD